MLQNRALKWPDCLLGSVLYLSFSLFGQGKDTAIVVLKETFDLQYIVDSLSLHMLSCNLDKDPSGARNPEWWGHTLFNYIDYIDTEAKSRHLKNWPVKGLCGRCLSEFIDRWYSQSCWYFRPSFVNCYLSYLPSALPPLPYVNMYTEYTYVQCERGGYGVTGG